MSLTACRECQQQVSTEAGVCPACGARRPARPTPVGDAAQFGERHKLLTILYALVAAGTAISITAWLLK